MYAWDCCRACLGVDSLHPIFTMPEHHEKYTEIILSATGLKVEFNDVMPQEMCTACINFINDTYKFRKKCEETEKALLLQLSEKQTYKVKIENSMFKTENGTHSIDISDLIIIKNYDQEGSDNDLNYESIDNQEYEPQLNSQDVEEKPVNIFKSKKKKQISDKPLRRSVRSKKEMEKKERVKEEIECEYCHKVLSSRLSLRNHYKIHTGFDVVCEHCGKKFITKRLLLMHCRAKHGYEKTDKCSYCDYKASNAEQVKIHERLHTGEKPFVCAECGAGFHRKSSYLQHVAIHLPDKTVQCDICPARFKSVTLMRIHKNRHRAPQYSFKCRICDNSFARRRNVARHLQRIHAMQPAPQHIDRLKIT